MGVPRFMDDDNFMVFSTDEITIDSNADVEWNLDGDPYRARKIDIKCLKKRLSLFVPKE